VRLVAATTRAPRLKEQHGEDYYFLSRDEFKKAIEGGDIVEHAYFPNRDEYYGTYRPELEKKLALGRIPIATTDRIGAKYLKDQYNATTISIVPSPIESLRARFLTRDPNVSEEWIARRIENCKEEIELSRGHFDYTIENVFEKLGETLVEVDRILRKEGYIE
jgi:guanylate kinase